MLTDKQKLLADILLRQDNLLLTGHTDADGDCVASILALYHAFNGASRGWQILLDALPEDYLAFLPTDGQIKLPDDVITQPDAVLLVDCNSYQRSALSLTAGLADGLPLYILDHHVTTEPIGELALIDTEAAAAGELVCRIIEAAGIAFDADTATCLYTAIAFDTGGFRHLNTTAQSHFWAERLLHYPIDLELIHTSLFDDHSLANIKLLSTALAGMELYRDGLIALMSVSLADKQKAGASRDDCNSITGYALSLKGVKIGIFLEETEDYIRVSLRCRRGYNVRDLAAEFGGGGHVLAAGCKIKAPLNEAKKQLIAACARS